MALRNRCSAASAPQCKREKGRWLVATSRRLAILLGPPGVERPEAIRRLIELALTVKAKEHK